MRRVRQKRVILKPFFSFYGGKRRVAWNYPKPQHKTIVEPFAGSAGYSVCHYEHDVCLYDIDPKICGVWEYLIGVSEGEVLSLPLLFDHVDELKIVEEAKWLLGFWINRGTNQPCKQFSKWALINSSIGIEWGTWCKTIRQRIAYQIQFIQHWKILNLSYKQLDNREATWFIDPPYSTEAGRRYKFNHINYPNLAEWCKERIGQVIVCEQRGAKWLDFRTFKNILSTHNKKCNIHSDEVIWTQAKLTT